MKFYQKGIVLSILTSLVVFAPSCGKNQNVAAAGVGEYPLGKSKHAQAIFAGGCFWCMEAPFDKLPGVKATIVGYTGGPETAPNYKQVAGGRTGHCEAVVVEYDPKVVTYEKLLKVFWSNINPTQKDGQFYDRGPQYRTGVFYLNDTQKKLAEESRKNLANSGKFKLPIVTEITRVGKFWKAEEYHQDFYKKNPGHYYDYRRGSGRDAFIEKHWGKQK